jgi:hypothetical protein
MDCAEKVVIACYLLDEGVEGADIAQFVLSIEGGCLRGERDALALRDAFLERPFDGVPAGVLGDVVRLMAAKMEMDEVRREFALGLGGLRDIERLVSHVPQNEVGARVAVRRVQDVVRLFQAGA